MAKIMSIANQKGGVGKTTTTINLGSALAKRGKRVLLVDLDPQGNLSSCLGYEPDDNPTISDLLLAVTQGAEPNTVMAIQHNESEGVDYIPATIKLSQADFMLINAICREKALANVLAQLTGYDYILIDCLPSLGILMINALTAAQRLVIPVQTQKLALDGMSQLLDVVSMIQRTVNPNLSVVGIVATMFDHYSMSNAVVENLEETYGSLLFQTVIGKSVEATNSTYQQKSLVLMKGSKLGKQYEKLADELLAREEGALHG